MLELDEILDANATALAEVRRSFISKGWVFVKIPKELLELRESIQQPLQKFFAQHVDTKDTFTKTDSIFGYQRVNHKESLRWLTSERFTEEDFPDIVRADVVALTKFMDDLMYRLIATTSQALFDKTPEQLGDEFDLALLSSKKQKDTGRFGMLDVAHYLNLPRDGSNTVVVPPKNCVEHYDPGLFSLSFFSSQPGLQLLDLETHEWVDGPCNTENGNEDVAILWCGAAISKIDQQFKPAVHRVEYPEQKDGSADTRMSIWYEVCTSAQETDYLKFENSAEIPPNVFVKKTRAKKLTDKPEHVLGRPPKAQKDQEQAEKPGWFSSLKSLLPFGKKKSNLELDYGVPISKAMFEGDDGNRPPITYNPSPSPKKTPESEPTSKVEISDLSVENLLGVPPSKSMSAEDFNFVPEEFLSPPEGKEPESEPES